MARKQCLFVGIIMLFSCGFSYGCLALLSTFMVIPVDSDMVLPLRVLGFLQAGRHLFLFGAGVAVIVIGWASWRLRRDSKHHD